LPLTERLWGGATGISAPFGAGVRHGSEMFFSRQWPGAGMWLVFAPRDGDGAL
jgi:hypothetical protein